MRRPAPGRASALRMSARHGPVPTGPAVVGRPGIVRGVDGFSLVEMLVTLAILGLAVTMASRSLGGTGTDRRPLHVSDALAAEIGRLRADALRSGHTGRLVFEPLTSRFLSSRAGVAPIAAPAMRVSVEADASDRAVAGEIRFLPDGSSTGGRIVLETQTARVIVSVGALTGRVRREDVR